MLQAELSTVARQKAGKMWKYSSVGTCQTGPALQAGSLRNFEDTTHRVCKAHGMSRYVMVYHSKACLISCLPCPALFDT